jgi:hypothetical protein
MNQPKKYPITDRDWAQVFSRRFPDAFPLHRETCEEYGTERYLVSLECYEAKHEDWQRAIDKKRAAEDSLTEEQATSSNLREKLRNARWILAVYHVALLLIVVALWFGGRK